MAEKCDCLNSCGDDARVMAYMVEPCAWRLRRAKARQAELQAEIDHLLADAAVRLDAARYRCLRSADWSVSGFCVVLNPLVSVRLGTDCPSLERLDAILDEKLAKESRALTNG